jgi:hypothetical protein
MKQMGLALLQPSLDALPQTRIPLIVIVPLAIVLTLPTSIVLTPIVETYLVVPIVSPPYCHHHLIVHTTLLSWTSIVSCYLLPSMGLVLNVALLLLYSLSRVSCPIIGSSTHNYLSSIILGRLCIVVLVSWLVGLSISVYTLVSYPFNCVFIFTLLYFGRQL